MMTMEKAQKIIGAGIGKAKEIGQPMNIAVVDAGANCPSSDDLRHIAGLQKGGSGSSVIEVMQHAGGAASDGLRLSGV